MKMESSSSRGGICAVLSELGFCTLSIDVSEFCSGSFEGIETTGVGTRGVKELSTAGNLKHLDPLYSMVVEVSVDVNSRNHDEDIGTKKSFESSHASCEKFSSVLQEIVIHLEVSCFRRWRSGFEFRKQDHPVRIDRVSSLSEQGPGHLEGKKKKAKLYRRIGTSAVVNVEVTLLKNRR
ncbi:hypothetical protein Tco_1018353 [Tanacetum coccineum]|uniref:Uncharacterized protein n=1 Tax=Tanacetum coccineum TaxID=301880 RepID=A0ABQ5FVH3_9ASTR